MKRERAEACARRLRFFLQREWDAVEVGDVFDVTWFQAGLLELRSIEVRRFPADLDRAAKDVGVVFVARALVERLTLVQQTGFAIHGAQGNRNAVPYGALGRRRLVPLETTSVTACTSAFRCSAAIKSPSGS